MPFFWLLEVFPVCFWTFFRKNFQFSWFLAAIENLRFWLRGSAAICDPEKVRFVDIDFHWSLGRALSCLEAETWVALPACLSWGEFWAGCDLFSAVLPGFSGGLRLFPFRRGGLGGGGTNGPSGGTQRYSTYGGTKDFVLCWGWVLFLALLIAWWAEWSKGPLAWAGSGCCWNFFPSALICWWLEWSKCPFACADLRWGWNFFPLLVTGWWLEWS